MFVERVFSPGIYKQISGSRCGPGNKGKLVGVGLVCVAFGVALFLEFLFEFLLLDVFGLADMEFVLDGLGDDGVGHRLGY